MKEKRLATILYADLTGFTQLTSELGPEKITELVNDCFETIDSIIHIHDGTILRHEGDRVMAVFGFPKSHGNDSYSAILSALRIQSAMKKLSHPVEAHVGIATGEVVCEDNNIYGYVIETASELEEEASVDEILTDRNCFDLNKTFFEFEKISKNNKVFYKLLAERKLQKQYQNRFLDREKEIATLTNLIKKSEKIIIITGEPGCGKTRFIYETICRINGNDSKFNFLQTSFLTTRSMQFYESILKIITELNPNYEPGADDNLLSESYNVKLYNEFCENIFSASKTKPLILHFQYFDRVDKNSLEFFKFLVNNLGSHNTTLIFEMHELHGAILDALKSVTKHELQIIELLQLNKETQINMAADLLTDIDVPKDTLDKITRYAGGNPLFLSEVCHFVKSQHSMGKVVTEIKIPYRIREVFNHLIDHIPLGVFNSLSIGVLYGYTINRKFFETAIANFEETMSYALDNGIIECNNGEITFKNTFFRDEIYNRIPKGVKKEIHRKIAAILRENSSDQDTDKMLAYHFKECSDYELALHYALKWAKKLKDMHATETALEAYNDALIISEKINNKAEYRILIARVDLLNLLGKREEEKEDIERLTEIIKKDEASEEKYIEVLLCKGRYLENISDFDQAIKIYEGYNKKTEDARILQRLGLSYFSKSKYTKAIETLNEALNIAKKERNIKKQAIILRHLGSIFWKMGEKEKSLEYSKRALNLFDSIGDNVSKAHVIAVLGNVYGDLSRYTEALDCYDKALKVAKKIGDVSFQSRMYNNTGYTYIPMGEYEKALNYYEKALQINTSTMNKKGQAMVINNIGEFYKVIGNYEDAISFFEKALKINEEIGEKTGTAIRLGNMGICYTQLGELSKASDYLKKSVELCIDLNLVDLIAFYKNELAIMMIHSNRFDEATKLARDATNLAHKSKYISFEIVGLALQGLAHLNKGNIKKAYKYSREAVNALEKIKVIESRNKSDIYYIHYQILTAMNKINEAQNYLDLAYIDVKERADRITNDNLKNSFLNNIKTNKEITGRWQALKNQK